MAFETDRYGTAFSSLLSETRTNPLDGGTPNTDARPDLDALTAEAAFAGKKIVDADMAECCVSAVWLYHNFLDESHTISQGIHSTSGSYWHGIMHRREPDFPNSKYWFRKVGDHEVFDDVAFYWFLMSVMVAVRSPPTPHLPLDRARARVLGR